ncbi:MAG: hypothetical protein JO277_14475, partial [Candidatus Eremiobacteraeota bacterium]|nr:hypothetical protein [Candidatus Eremiobacteraeota bacterium]
MRKHFTGLATATIMLSGVLSVAACVQQPFMPLGPAGVGKTPAQAKPAFRVVYRFGLKPNDGKMPTGGLTLFKGVLYGTTQQGGTGRCFATSSQPIGCGTVFSLATTGQEHVIYNFRGGSDGEAPNGDLVTLNGALYGTTHNGGCGTGTVFGITPSGKEIFRSALCTKAQGVLPSAGLTQINGVLFGVASDGGLYNLGSIFSVAPPGPIRRILSFGKVPNSGSHPTVKLTRVHGALFGAAGTFFKATPSGHLTTLNRANPVPALNAIDLQNGTLYGSSTAYRSSTANGAACRLNYNTGAIVVLYAFKGKADGESPQGGLRFLNGLLYGTALGGAVGDGTIYSMTPSGAFRLLYSFRNSVAAGP